MYAEVIKSKFPQDEREDMYKVPHLPAVKLGKILRKNTRISSPNDVLALHIFEGLFNSEVIILTPEKCFYNDGSFLWEDVKEFKYEGNDCTILVNRKGKIIPHYFSVKNEQVAKTFQRIFSDIVRHDPTSDIWIKPDYSEDEFRNEEINWLNLRDEVMRTIDMLYDRFNDGKLSMLEYENKKQELLDRL